MYVCKYINIFLLYSPSYICPYICIYKGGKICQEHRNKSNSRDKNTIVMLGLITQWLPLQGETLFR